MDYITHIFCVKCYRATAIDTNGTYVLSRRCGIDLANESNKAYLLTTYISSSMSYITHIKYELSFSRKAKRIGFPNVHLFLVTTNTEYLPKLSVTHLNVSAKFICIVRLHSPVGVHVLRQIVRVRTEHRHRLKLPVLLGLPLRLPQTVSESVTVFHTTFLNSHAKNLYKFTHKTHC